MSAPVVRGRSSGSGSTAFLPPMVAGTRFPSTCMTDRKDGRHGVVGLLPLDAGKQTATRCCRSNISHTVLYYVAGGQPR